mmetsp:Transcript_32070/g.37696  ORF Transcript_32070/g.37696 Transcript_32070/m.37696 type:complete len:225 (-) Transcript_32070:312-986(-)
MRFYQRVLRQSKSYCVINSPICFLILIFMSIFITLFILGSNKVEIETKCEVLTRFTNKCEYQSCTGGRFSRCTTEKSSKYTYQYIIHEIKLGTCNRTIFESKGSCNGKKYLVGDKRKCYVSNNCHNHAFESSSNTLLIWAWIMFSVACFFVLIYIDYSISCCRSLLRSSSSAQVLPETEMSIPPILNPNPTIQHTAPTTTPLPQQAPPTPLISQTFTPRSVSDI